MSFTKFAGKIYLLCLFFLCFYFWSLIFGYCCCCTTIINNCLWKAHCSNYNQFIVVILVVKAILNPDYRIIVNTNANKVVVMVVNVGNGIAKGVFIV